MSCNAWGAYCLIDGSYHHWELGVGRLPECLSSSNPSDTARMKTNNTNINASHETACKTQHCKSLSE